MLERAPEKLIPDQETSEPEESEPSDLGIAAKEYEDLIPDEVVLAAKAGGYEGHEAKGRVITAYLPLIRAILHRYRVDKVLADDLYQEGVLALYRAIKTWNPERVKFAPYAFNMLRREIGRVLTKARGRGRGGKREKPKMVYLDKPLSEEGESSRYRDLPSSTPTPEAEVAYQEEFKGVGWQKTLMDYIENMPGLPGEVLRARFMDHMTNKSIAQALRMDEYAISRQLKHALTMVLKDLPELHAIVPGSDALDVFPSESYRGRSQKKQSAE